MSIKALLTRIIAKLDKPFIERAYSLSNQSSTTWYKNFAINVGVTGYTPIGLCMLQYGQANKTTYWRYFSGDTLNLGIANGTASGTISALNINVKVIYIRSDLLS